MKKIAITLLALWACSSIAEPDKTTIFNNGSTEVNLLSDYEAGTRFHERGDMRMAMTMFQQGADKGDARAMFALGTHHYFGEGVPKDYARARALFEQADAKGHRESSYILSLMHGRGEGVPADDQKAVAYLQSAARGCVRQAAEQLAQMHYQGQVFPQDKLRGIAWLSIAADLPDADTKQTVRDIQDALGAKERAVVQQIETEERAQMTCPT